MKLKKQYYEEIRQWIYRNGRQIELSLWEFHFENGSSDCVLTALEFYQNIDGGFGHALEADNWNPDSSPYTTLYAVNILKSIGFIDKNHKIYKGIMKYLESGRHFENNQWLFSIPSNDRYPHAPWWAYSQDANMIESTGLTAELIAFILEYFDKESEIYKKSLNLVKNILDNLMNADEHGEMGIGGYLVLIDKLKALDIPVGDLEMLQDKLRKQLQDSIEHDSSKWKLYGVRPSNYIISPDSPYYEQNKDIVEKELDYIIQTKPENDVWGITWTWFDNNEKYAKEFAISENWWKSCKAIEKLIFLRNFDRLI